MQDRNKLKSEIPVIVVDDLDDFVTSEKTLARMVFRFPHGEQIELL